MPRRILSEGRIERLLACGEMRESGALRRCALDVEMTVFLQGGGVCEDRLDFEAETPEVIDELQAWGIDVAPVDQ